MNVNSVLQIVYVVSIVIYHNVKHIALFVRDVFKDQIVNVVLYAIMKNVHVYVKFVIRRYQSCVDVVKNVKQQNVIV